VVQGKAPDGQESTPIEPMKLKLVATAAMLTLSSLVVYSQDLSSQVIDIGKYYSSYMFMNEAPRSAQNELGVGYDDRFRASTEFIKECSKQNNSVLTATYLALPDTFTLKVIYIVDALHQNPHRKQVIDAKLLVDSLLMENVPYHELVDEYYSTLFTAFGNKNKPFNMSKVNFRMKDYGLDSDLLNGIFYLRCMEHCATQIFGFMNIVKPPNTSKAMEIIRKFPKFNDSDYFRYSDLYFPDFEMEIFNDKGLQSYKGYFVDKLYSTLLNHLVCLNAETKDQERIMELLLGSILKDSTLYKYTVHQETLEGIFREH